MTDSSSFSLECPLPIRDYPVITLAHGGGGSLMRALIEKIFITAFNNEWLAARHDGAVFPAAGERMALTTDSYVVQPLFFPGGDIGSLAVNGTVNDLAMCGARPLYLSAGFIIEEGLATETLWRVANSMRRAADRAGVRIVTGDTKVVDRGKGDGLFINTAGIGVVANGVDIAPRCVQEGDAILLSGDIGRHGIAIMAVREGLRLETAIESDCAPLCDPVLALLAAGVEVHCLRDLTRGGLGAALVEIAETAGVNLALDEETIPVRDEVRGACEILGLDPLSIANEVRFIAVVPERDAERARDLLRTRPETSGASLIGRITGRGVGQVALRTRLGASRIVSLPGGEQLPRIC